MRILPWASKRRVKSDDPSARVVALYEAFNARSLDEVLAQLHPDVEWPNAWEGGHLRGRAEVRSYWRRQWAEIDPQVQPLNVRVDSDGSIVVLLHQVVHDLKGNTLSYGTVEHVFRLRDGLIDRMEIRTVDPK